MMQILSDQLKQTVYLGCLGLSLIAPAISHASLVGDAVSVAFVDTASSASPNYIGSYSDNITVGGEPAIAGGDGSHIGGHVLLDGESISIGDGAGPNTGFITFNIQGGGNPLPAPQANYYAANYNSGDYYTITGLVDPALSNSYISGLSVTFGENSTLNLPNAVNVLLNTDVFFSANAVTLNMAQIGILYTNSGAADYGSVTLNLQFAPSIAAVPIPATILLFIPGLAMLRPRVGWTRNSRGLAAL
jgi:hypothetical protein